MKNNVQEEFYYTPNIIARSSELCAEVLKFMKFHERGCDSVELLVLEKASEHHTECELFLPLLFLLETHFLVHFTCSPSSCVV